MLGMVAIRFCSGWFCGYHVQGLGFSNKGFGSILFGWVSLEDGIRFGLVKTS